MLTAIECVTMTAPDIALVERAYTSVLRFRVLRRGVIGGALAESWNAPRMAGRSYVLLGPESGAPCLLRIVEAPGTDGYAAMLTHGWNINELLVQDPDALAARLAASEFRILSMPRALDFNPAIRAMEVLGPAGELLYLTRMPEGGGAGGIRATAETLVDRTFIVALGGPDLEAMRSFYRDVLGLPVSKTFAVGVPALNEAWQRSPGEKVPLALAPISEAYAVELDEYPGSTAPRPCRPGELPPGIAMVSFSVKSIPHDLAGIDKLQRHPVEPYDGRRSAVLRGPAGELIELIESRA